MADNTKIEWTDTTWNPVTGCTKVSPGCAHCYAESVDHRFDHDKVGKLPWALPASQGGRGVTLHPQRLEQPLKWCKPRKVFVNSMSDLFHEDVPEKFIAKVYAIMDIARHHTYQVLTKRPDRALELLSSEDFQFHVGWFQSQAIREYGMPEMKTVGPWPLRNVWLGVSVENQHWANIRIPLLRRTPAETYFVSYEPSLRMIDFTTALDSLVGVDGFTRRAISQGMSNSDRVDSMRLPIVDQIIIGGESGPRARPCAGGIENAARSTIQQCRRAGVAPFVKQMGAVWARQNGIKGDLKGGDMEHWPEDLRVREYPKVAEAVTDS